MIRRPPRSTQGVSSAASDVYKRQVDARGKSFVLIALVGWIGCQVDSILGALLENEGYIGKHSVNFLATLSGALMAFIAWGRVF